jgi:uncharacterized protein
MFIDVKQVPQEGLSIESEISAERLGNQEDARLVDRVRISGRLTPVEESTFCMVGKMDASVETGCVRCLESFVMEIHEDLDLLYLPQSKNVGLENAQDEERELSDRDLAVSFYRDEKIELKQMIWEQVHLALPMKPLCKQDCRGLCPQCGTNLNLSACDCVREVVDPRLAILKTLLKS